MRWIILLVLPLFIQTVAAQQPAAGNNDHELIRQLVERVQQLEAEVKELKGQRAAATAPRTDPVSAQAAAALPPQAAAAPPQVNPMSGMAPALASEFAKMRFRGYSDVFYRATDQRGERNTFGLGQFNLFITSRLSNRLSFLSETVIEADNQNSVGVELERLLLQYSASDYFNVSFGRYHTAIGWYNTAYHHSSWMQTATGRPFLFDFEDNGGILPIHNVGISAGGRIPSGQLGLRYIAEIGNGRASRSPLDESVQSRQDENRGKAVNFSLMARPEQLRGFEAGFSVYHDNLTPAGTSDIGETIMAAHAVYQGSTFEWLNEALVIRHSISDKNRVLHTPGFYSQLSRRFGVVRPYFRYQYANAPDGDLVFKDVGRRHGPSLGIRYDFSDFAAFKLQYDRAERRGQNGFNGITTQLSFSF